MRPEDVRTAMVDINGFRMQFNQAEKNKILRLGEESIRKEIEHTNILKDAEKNSRQFVEDFYKQMGYDEVVIIQRNSNEK
jgi:regulator of replication initiation timing